MLKEVLKEFIFWYMSKDDAINLMDGSNLADKRGALYFFLLCIKMSECADLTYYQRNQYMILNRAKDDYENDKERLREQVIDKYRNLSEEEKYIRREYGKNRYRNMFEETKQRLKEYQKKNIKKIIVRLKSLSIIMNKIVF